MLSLFFPKKRLLSDPKLLGKWGENRVVRYLKGRGYRVLALNFCSTKGEVDIVAYSPSGEIAFVEVKTRRNEDYMPAIAAVGTEKQKRIALTAKYFLKSNNVNKRAIRFDIAIVILGEGRKPELTYYKNAFLAPFQL